ncbi:hypothetical protein EDF19_0494 [Curtobacterium sp. PhB115]|nr:hypothetical protein EDF19_0494 [Curtobacterium sp. PhB115]
MRVFNDPAKQQAWTIASEVSHDEVSTRGMSDPSGDIALDATHYLFDLRAEWMRPAYEDIDSERLLVWLDRFFDYQEGVQLAIRSSWAEFSRRTI